jgi:hypothetical protein
VKDEDNKPQNNMEWRRNAIARMWGMSFVFPLASRFLALMRRIGGGYTFGLEVRVNLPAVRQGCQSGLEVRELGVL